MDLNWEENFRILRSGRSSTACPSFMAANKNLLVLQSPVSVNLRPINEQTFDCDETSLSAIAAENGLVEVWKRGDAYIGLQAASGLRMFDFAVGHHWEAMFLPNGEGSWEWRLGLDVSISDDSALFICSDPDCPQLHIVPGIITARQLALMNCGTGLSIAVRAREAVHVKRGASIARMMLISEKYLRASINFVE